MAEMLSQDEHSRPIERAGPASGGATLEELCSDLGPDLLEIVGAPDGFDVPITEVVLHDALEAIPDAPGPGRLLLAIGLPSGPGAAERLIRSAAAAGVSAVACRNVEAWPRAVVSVAETEALSLLEIAEHVELSDLFELVRTAVAVDRQLPAENLGEPDRPGPGDLFALAELTAAVAGGPVTIDDTQSRILAFSAITGSDDVDEARLSTILNRRVPEPWMKEMRERGILEHLLTSGEVLHVDSKLPNKRPRRVIAIRLGASVLGSIWLAGGDETLSAEADEALRRAAPIAAFLMMRQRIGVKVERRMIESRVATLLREGDRSTRGLELVGLAADTALVVIAVEAAPGRASSPAPVGPRVVDLLSMQLHSYRRPAVASSPEERSALGLSSEDERLFVLANCEGEADRRELHRIMTECVRYASKVLGARLRAGIGFEVEDPEEIPLGRRSAEECLEFAPAEQRVSTFEDVQDRSLLAEVERVVTDRRSGPSGAYRALVDYDARHETDFVSTLRAVLDSSGNVIQVAKRLHLHANSVRYRVKRASEIAGIDLEDADARLALELELRARSAP